MPDTWTCPENDGRTFASFDELRRHLIDDHSMARSEAVDRAKAGRPEE